MFDVTVTASLKINKYVEEAASLSRLWHHVENNPMGAFTAYRGGIQKQEKGLTQKQYKVIRKAMKRNRENNAILEKEIQKMGFGYIRVRGSYPEDIKNDKDEVIDKRVVEEESLVVFGKPEDEKALYHFMMRQGKKYNQDSVLFKGTNNKTASLHFDAEGKVEPYEVGEFTTKNMTEYLTRMYRASPDKGKKAFAPIERIFEFRDKTKEEKNAQKKQKESRQKNALLNVGQRAKKAETKWWETLTLKQQQKYLKQYPNSKFKITKT